MIARIANYIRIQLRRSPFTVTGRLLALSAAFCLFAIVEPNLSALLSYVLWLLMIAFVCGLLFRPRLQLKPGWTGLIISGQIFHARLEIKNQGLLGAYDMQCTLELSHDGLRGVERNRWISLVAPGESATLEYPIQAMKRGVHEIGQLTVASLFPLSLYRFLSFYLLHHTIVVAPRYETHCELVGEIVKGLDLHEAAGQNKQGSQLEYIGSRDFRPGVPVRRWDFASWARLGTPSVREFAEGSDSLVVIVVDLTRRRFDQEDSQLEAVLSIAAGVVMQLAKLGHSVRVVYVSRLISIADCQGSGGHYDDILIQLAKVQGEPRPIAWTQTWEDILAVTAPDATLLAILSDVRGSESLRHAQVGSRKVIQQLITSNDQVPNKNVQPPSLYAKEGR